MAGCSLAMPERPADDGPLHVRPDDLSPWHVQVNGFDDRRISWSNSSSSMRDRRFSHPHMFIPRNAANATDDWRAAIRASQHPPECRAARYLLVEDDMIGSGLGFTGRLLASALLLAMRQGRVLLEIPRRTAHTGAPYSRWCARPPHSLQCVYDPWSHCPLPNTSNGERLYWFEERCACKVGSGGRPEHYPLNTSCREHPEQFDAGCFLYQLRDKRLVAARLSSLYAVGPLWMMFRVDGADARALLQSAHRFLFRPRAWVSTAASCIMEHARLRPGRFIAVHIRTSPQKVREVGARRLPAVPAYLTLARRAADASGLRRLFVQTASPSALALFLAAAAAVSPVLEVSHTFNPRAENDS